MLTRWVREADTGGDKALPGGGTPRDEEVARLKRELARVTKERDFFKGRDSVLREAVTERYAVIERGCSDQDLSDEGMPASVNRGARPMARAGLQAPADPTPLRRQAGGSPVGIENKLERDFQANEPEAKWVTDITEVVTPEGKLYQCVVIDLYSKLVVG